MPRAQDIDECNHSTSDYPCNGICTNTPGGYKCTCPAGTTAAGDPKKVTCMPDRNALSLPLPLILGLGLGFGLLFLLFCNLCAVWEFQRRKLKKLKRVLFERHGGDFLKQQLSSFRGSNFRIYSEEQLKRATNKFHHDHIVGEGSQGTVYKGTLEPNGEVAIKRFKGIDEKRSKEFAQEIIILSQLFHKNVVKLLGCCLEVEAPMLVYEFTPGGNLFDLIHSRERRGQFSLDARIRIAAETAEALAYLHSYAATPIIHGDIKSSNILLDETHIPKVSDFRASRLAPKNKVQLATVVQGTCGYLDPEYLQTCQLTEKSDVYSFGVVLVELLTRKKPLDFEGPEEERSLALHFVSSMKEDRLLQILDDELVQEGEMKRLLGVAQLACQCLILKGADRPTMKEVVISLNAIGKFPKAPMVP
uniref:Wall-associated receptor kinase 3 n=1 Tax=Anthurium amnicola TaxID=1678845 RepID=A0A1D1Z8N6_9ARAE